jgi:DNA modification methylase
VALGGSYDTKRTFYTTLRNQEDNIKYGHPTVKPLHIIQNLIVNSTDMGGVILDPFIGSGTTAVACIKEKRHFIGYELNKDYYDKAVRRIQAEQAQLTFF